MLSKWNSSAPPAWLKGRHLTDEQYLRGARLVIDGGDYVLVAPILDAPQADFVG